MDKTKREEIINRLDEKGVRALCPRCGNNSFSVLDGYFIQTIQDEVRGGIVLGGGKSIPSVITVCNKCGFISQHALGALGLLPQKAKEEKDD